MAVLSADIRVELMTQNLRNRLAVFVEASRSHTALQTHVAHTTRISAEYISLPQHQTIGQQFTWHAMPRITDQTVEDR
jgi:hypothetical protein